MNREFEESAKQNQKKRTCPTNRLQGIQKHKKPAPPKERTTKYLTVCFPFLHVQTPIRSKNCDEKLLPTPIMIGNTELFSLSLSLSLSYNTHDKNKHLCVPVISRLSKFFYPFHSRDQVTTTHLTQATILNRFHMISIYYH